MVSNRIKRVNSLLTEVINRVIFLEVKDPLLPKLTSVSSVETLPDLSEAKVFVSIIGTEQEKKDGLAALNRAAGFIAVNSSKKVVIRFFPKLSFYLDRSSEKHEKIQKIFMEQNIT